MKVSVLERNVELLLTRSYRMERASPALRARIAASLEREFSARTVASHTGRPRVAVRTRWTRPMVALAAGLTAALFGAGAWMLWRATNTHDARAPELADGRAMMRATGDASWRILSESEVRSGVDIADQSIELRTAAHASARLWLGAAGRVDAADSTEILVDARRAPDELEIDLRRGSLELERYAAGGSWTVHSQEGEVVLERGAVKIACASSISDARGTGAALGAAASDIVCARLLRGAGSAGDAAHATALELEQDTCLQHGRIVTDLVTVASASSRQAATTSTPNTSTGEAPPAADPTSVTPSATPSTGDTARASLRATLEAGENAPSQVTVTLLRRERLPKVSQPRTRACTVADGTFTVDGIAPGTYRVCVAARGFALWQIPEIEFTSAMVELTVRLDRGAPVRGKVVDARSGEPIVDALVLSESDTPVQVLEFVLQEAPSPEWPSWSRTQSDGTFEIEHLSFGKHILRATHKGFAPAWSDAVDLARDGRAHDVLLQLDQGSVIHGHVADNDGAPWPQAIIIASIMDMSFARPCMSFGYGIADAEGAYRIEDLPVGSYVILNVSNTKNTESEDPVTSLVSSTHITRPLSDIEINLPGATQGTRFLGHLLGPDGSPRAGLDVSLQRVDHPDATGWLAARSGSDGSFQFARVEPGPYDLYVGENLGAKFVYQCTVEIPKVPDFAFDVRLASGVLRVRALDAETAKSPGECAVILEHWTDRGYAFAGRNITDASGEATFRHMPAGIYRAQVFAIRGHYGPESTAEATLGPDAREVTLDVALHTGAGIDIVALDARGQGVARASVTFIDEAGNAMQFNADDITDNNGRLHVQGIRPGRWRVKVEHVGYRAQSTSIDLEVGDVREITIPLESLEQKR